MGEILCGIYCIENTINHRKYIGLSRDIQRRWYEHRSELRRGIHINTHLQNAWNTYGEKAFHFYIIELCNFTSLSERECYYISKYKTLSHESGYNITAGGENTNNSKKAVIDLATGEVYGSVHEIALSRCVADVTMIGWCRKRHKFMYFSEYNELTQDEKDACINFDWDTIDHLKLSAAHSRDNLSSDTIRKLSDATSGSSNPRAFAIFSPELNESFWGAKEAQEKYGINSGSISSYLNGKLQSAGKHPITGEKLTWQKIEK